MKTIGLTKYLPILVETSAPVDSAPLQRKGPSFSYEFMFSRSMFGTTDMVEQHRFLGEVAKLFSAGKVRTHLAETLGPINAANLREAHAQLEAGGTLPCLALIDFSRIWSLVQQQTAR